MIDARVRGKSNREIAQEFGVSENTVARTLTWAKKAELVVKAEDKILAELVPAAHDAILKALKGENAEVAAKAALEIFKGTLPSFSKRPSGAGATASDSPDLASYITKLRGNLTLDGETIDAESSSPALEGSPRLALPAAAESSAAEGLSSAAASDGSTTHAEGNAAGSE
jgi:hypothetical protein